MLLYDVFYDCIIDDYFFYGCSWFDFDFDDVYFREYFKLELNVYFIIK